MKILTAERLREVLDYDPATGAFTWRVQTGARARVGSIAGTTFSNGYHHIKIDGGRHTAHRLAFLYVEGMLPPDQVDHINGVPSDNRYANLRKATNAENNQNLALSVKNTSGMMGASWNRTLKKWESRIRAKGKKLGLGLFDTAEEAHAAYLAAKKALHTFNPVPR